MANSTDIGEARDRATRRPRKKKATGPPPEGAGEGGPQQLSFGQQFRAWREATGLSQGDLAALTDDKQSYISHVENGLIQQPNPTKLAKFAPALGVPLLDLLIAAGFVTREQLGALPVDPDLEALILAMRGDAEFMAQIRRLGGDENRVLRDVIAAMKIPLTTYLRERRDPPE